MDNTAHFPDAPQWPEQQDAPPAVGSIIGHNQPPEAVAVFSFTSLLNNLAQALQDAPNKAPVLAGAEIYEQRIADLAESAKRATVTNDNEAGRAGELVKQIRAATKAVETAHGEAKAPYLAAGRKIDDAKNMAIAPLIEAKRIVDGRLNTFAAQKEAERLAQERALREAEEARQREEAEQLAAEGVSEAEQAQIVTAAAPVAKDAGIIRGDYGAAVSGRKEWTYQIEDYHTALLEVADNAKVREAVEKAIGALVRSGQHNIKGVRVYQQVKANVR